MKAIASLIREHEVISLVADALELYARSLERRQRVEPGDLGRFVEVFQELGDCIHHEKEENILLPLLSRNGFEWDRGLLADVRLEHRHERYLMDVLFQASQREGAWSNDERRHVATSALALADFQRRHHELENRWLFPQVGERLNAAAQNELAAALESFDADLRHLARRERAIERALDLARNYATEPAGKVRQVRADAVSPASGIGDPTHAA